MPQIPKFDSRYGESLSINNTNADRQLYVPPARTNSLEGFGKAVGAVASDLSKIYAANEERKAADYITKESARINEHLIRELDAKKKKAIETGSVEGFTENFLGDFDKLASGSLSSAPNKIANKKMNDRLASVRNSLLEDSINFESKTRINLYKHNLDIAADNYAKSAAIDPGQIPSMLNAISEDMRDAARTIGLADTEDRIKDYKSKIVGTGMSQAIHDNPYNALELINKFAPDLSAKDYVSLKGAALSEQKRVEGEAKAARKEAEYIAQVNAAVVGNNILDPTDKKAQQAIDKWYNVQIKNDPSVDLTDIIIQTNILPSAMKSDLAGKINSGTDDQKVQASLQLAKLHNFAPNLITHLSERDKSKAFLIAQNTQAGVPPGRAVEWAEKQVLEKNDLLIKSRGREASKEDLLKFNSVAKNFTYFFGPKADAIPLEMQSEFETLARNYYVNNNLSATQAQTNALNDLKAMWYPSKVTGRTRYMKDSPEIVFGNQAGVDWIGEQFEADYLSVSQLGGVIPTKDDLDNLVLSPNVVSRDGLPIYNIFREDKKTGIIDQVFNEKGRPVIFYPDWSKSPLYTEMMKKYPGNTPEEREKAFNAQILSLQLKQSEYGQNPPTRNWINHTYQGRF